MMISASIYGNRKLSLVDLIKELIKHSIDIIHIDSNDDLNVFDDIKQIRNFCSLPIDLHIITSNPNKYWDLLVKNQVEYVTFQYENLKSNLNVPSEIRGKIGIAINSYTPISVFKNYNSFDFILIMATKPGKSGGTFNNLNFIKIQQFKNTFPDKSTHVDGGVNECISTILNRLGVEICVSGSYILDSSDINHALNNLRDNQKYYNLKVKDIMIPIEVMPIIQLETYSLEVIRNEIFSGGLDLALLIDRNFQLKGYILKEDIETANKKSINEIVKMCIDRHTPSSLSVVESYIPLEKLSSLSKEEYSRNIFSHVVTESNNVVGFFNYNFLA